MRPLGFSEETDGNNKEKEQHRNMKTEAQIRNALVGKVLEIPAKKLKPLSDFVSKLENTESKKSNVLSFSGVWSNIDHSVFKDLTENLLENRKSNRKSIQSSMATEERRLLTLVLKDLNLTCKKTLKGLLRQPL